jgi:hypothetical protein
MCCKVCIIGTWVKPRMIRRAVSLKLSGNRSALGPEAEADLLIMDDSTRSVSYFLRVKT